MTVRRPATPIAELRMSHLSDAQRRLVKKIAGGTAVWRQRKNMFGAPLYRVSGDVVDSVANLGLVEIRPGKPLGLTYAGKLFLAGQPGSHDLDQPQGEPASRRSAR